MQAQRKYAFLFFLFIVGISLYFIKHPFEPEQKVSVVSPLVKTASVQKVNPKLMTAKTSSVTPTPTQTPTPTPIVYSGFCLSVPVLTYHHVQPTAMAIQKKQTNLSVDNGMFDLQMGYLTSHGYTSITAKQLVDALRAHTGLSSKSIVITLDDGYKDVYTYAYPIFQKYHITANLMIATGLIGGSDYASWGGIEEMGRSGLIYFTDHTWSHYGVGAGTREKIKFEIETAKQQLEQHTGQKIELFTYPYGSFGAVSEQVLKEDGFTGAFSTIPGSYQCDSFLLTLHRTRIGNSPLSSYGF